MFFSLILRCSLYPFIMTPSFESDDGHVTRVALNSQRVVSPSTLLTLLLQFCQEYIHSHSPLNLPGCDRCRAEKSTFILFGFSRPSIFYWTWINHYSRITLCTQRSISSDWQDNNCWCKTSTSRRVIQSKERDIAVWIWGAGTMASGALFPYI